MPSNLPAQALSLTDIQDRPLKVAGCGMSIKISLHCTFPEDLAAGNYLVAREDTDLHRSTKEILA